MRDTIYKFAPYGFGASFLTFMVGWLVDIHAVMQVAAIIGIASTGIWIASVLTDPKESGKDKLLMNLLPFAWLFNCSAFLIS